MVAIASPALFPQPAFHPEELNSVKSLTNLTSIPASHIYTPDDDVAMDLSQTSIPVIDFSILTSGTPEQRSKAVQEIGKACLEWSFFMVINHGIPEDLQKAIIDGSAQFFNLTDAKKLKFQGSHALDPIQSAARSRLAEEIGESESLLPLKLKHSLSDSKCCCKTLQIRSPTFRLRLKPLKTQDRPCGNSVELTKSAAQASGLKGETASLRELPSSLRAAHEVAGCGYEYGTSWGEKVGWSYGSTTEDILTGIQIHSRGWKSMYCTPDPPAFLGCAPSGGPATMTQMKRWATGLLQILFSSNCPFIATFTGKLQFRQCLAYSWILLWGLRSIPELCYAILPAFCIISNSSFLPKIQEPGIVIPVSLFVIYNLYTIYEYFKFGLSIRAWWNNQRMVRIMSASAWFFGVLSVVLKLLGISETVFEITQKDQQSSGDGTDSGRFTFDESIAFVPGTTLVLVHLTALVTPPLKN